MYQYSLQRNVTLTTAVIAVVIIVSAACCIVTATLVLYHTAYLRFIVVRVKYEICRCTANISMYKNTKLICEPN